MCVIRQPRQVNFKQLVNKEQPTESISQYVSSNQELVPYSRIGNQELYLKTIYSADTPRHNLIQYKRFYLIVEQAV